MDLESWPYGACERCAGLYKYTLAHLDKDNPISKFIMYDAGRASPDALIWDLRSENGRTVFYSGLGPARLEVELFGRWCTVAPSKAQSDSDPFSDSVPPRLDRNGRAPDTCPSPPAEEAPLDLDGGLAGAARGPDGRILGIGSATMMVGIPEIASQESFSGAEKVQAIQMATTGLGAYDDGQFEAPVSERLAAEAVVREAELATREQLNPDWRRKVSTAALKLGMTEEQFVAMAIPLVLAILAVADHQNRHR